MLERVFYHWVIDRLSTNLFYSWRMKYCGKQAVLGKPLYFTPKYVSMGNGVCIWKNARIEVVTSYAGQKYNPEIIFEDGVLIQQNLHLTCAEKILIGKNTAIAANVTITDIHHSYDDIDIPIERQKLRVAPVIIGGDCKIYNNAVILQGVTIGRHVTVAANSVVTKNIPDYCVAAGAPARIVKRYNFEKEYWFPPPPPVIKNYWRIIASNKEDFKKNLLSA